MALTAQLPPAVALLISTGLIDDTVARTAVAAAAEAGDNPLRLLTEAGHVSAMDVLRVSAEAEGHTFLDVAEAIIEPSTVAVLPATLARRLNILPVSTNVDGYPVIAVAANQITNPLIHDDIARTLGHNNFSLVVAMRKAIDDRINALYRSEGELSALSDQMIQSKQDEQLNEPSIVINDASEQSPIVKAVNLLIRQAITDGASDIHLDPGEHALTVRYRIDAVLKVVKEFPAHVMSEFISRIKIMSELDPSQRRIPQDGRLTVADEHGHNIDLRVATLPTVWGEKVVMRILDNSNTMMSLTDLGFSDTNTNIFERSYTKPYGMILVTGPTGSGKSTTLYATLNQVAKPEINVITVEDPVEYKIAGISQVQAHNKAGLTFAAALRTILRSDPDVVLIGEIRDHETAQIAVQASLTGHMVMSTLHTNDAPSAVTRLVEMGIEPFLVGSALDAVLAQRLCRRLCARCKQPHPPERELLDAVGFPYDPENMPEIFAPVGCRHCSDTGYRGRMGLHEIMEVDSTIERLTVEGAPLDVITKQAIENGMVPMREDGWLKVTAGLTSIEEVLRVVI